MHSPGGPFRRDRLDGLAHGLRQFKSQSLFWLCYLTSFARNRSRSAHARLFSVGIERCWSESAWKEFAPILSKSAKAPLRACHSRTLTGSFRTALITTRLGESHPANRGPIEPVAPTGPFHHYAALRSRARVLLGSRISAMRPIESSGARRFGRFSRQPYEGHQSRQDKRGTVLVGPWPRPPGDLCERSAGVAATGPRAEPLRRDDVGRQQTAQLGDGDALVV